MISWNAFCITLLLAIIGIWGALETFSAELPSLSAAEDSQQSAGSVWTGELADGFKYLFKTVLSGSVIQPSDSSQNPHNDFLQIPRYILKGEFRPDFSLAFRDIKLSIKPRFVGFWQEWEDGPLKGQDKTNDDIYVNEWLASYKLHENWFVSYGRENLQWGPSFLLSPSNPFFRDNGQSNPRQEVKGMDFTRTLWVMSPAWTLSLIGNVGKGEQTFLYEFEPTYAIKIDYTAFRKYGSLIGSYTENDRFHLGGFGGWTVSDGLMLYTEGSISPGTNALYPRTTYFQPLDLELIRMVAAKNDSAALEALMLFGGSYTFESGQAVTAEYVFNSAGYSREEAESYYQYRRVASRFYGYPYPIGDLTKLALLQTLDPKLRLLRQNYLMLQYQETQIWEKLNLLIRYTINLDDTSSQLISMLGYDLGDHTQLFLIGNQNIGNTETEFGSFYEYGVTVGIEYIF
ncbi:MAG: hypothetical protein NTU74_09155 [Deltaproteobacteria bacterium]|nr:hypothetical protein [Deltaproteobacteria bacterium]